MFFFCFLMLECIATTGIHWVEFWLRLSQLENVSRAYVDNVVSSKWVKYKFWVNYHFKNNVSQNKYVLSKRFNIYFTFIN